MPSAPSGVPALVRRLAGVAASRKLTVAVAESCTGGLLAASITEAPGASSYFLGGVVAYSNEVKVGRLGVPLDDIRNHGAVSQAVATAMAKGVCRRFGAGLAMAATGVAGPDGGSPAKPVGTVWIAVAGAKRSEALQLHFDGSRRTVQERTVAALLLMGARFAEGLRASGRPGADE